MTVLRTQTTEENKTPDIDDVQEVGLSSDMNHGGVFQGDDHDDDKDVDVEMNDHSTTDSKVHDKTAATNNASGDKVEAKKARKGAMFVCWENPATF